MSWSKLAPIAKTTGRPMASASVQVNKDGVPKISLILSASLKDEFGDPKRADVSAGEGADEGSLLIEFTPKGAFEVKRFVSGGARLFLPIPPGCPQRASANCPCRLGEKTRADAAVPRVEGSPEVVDSVVVRLPIAEWRAAGPVTAPPASSAAPKPASPAPVTVGNGRATDPVAYLASKGHAISRLAGDRFQVNGETLQRGQVLKLVNDQRKAADLDPITAAQMS